MRSTRQQLVNRRNSVIELVRRGIDQVDAIAAELGVSAATVRRDLAALDRAGLLARTYGGAREVTPFHEVPLREREGTQMIAKGIIGKAAAALLPKEGTIFVDAGTTCASLLYYLPRDAHLTVVTRGLENAIIAAERPGVTVVMVGGEVAPLSHGTSGQAAVTEIRSHHYAAAFLGVDAVDPVLGVGEPTEAEVATKRAAIDRASYVFVLADHTKLEPSGVSAWTPLEHATIVTDPASEKLDGGRRLQEFANAGIHVRVGRDSSRLTDVISVR